MESNDSEKFSLTISSAKLRLPRQLGRSLKNRTTVTQGTTYRLPNRHFDLAFISIVSAIQDYLCLASFKVHIGVSCLLKSRRCSFSTWCAEGSNTGSAFFLKVYRSLDDYEGSKGPSKGPSMRIDACQPLA